MPDLSLTLRVLDVDGNLVTDPRVFVRVASLDGRSSAEARLELRGREQPIRLSSGPPGDPVVLRVTPSRYRDGVVLARVDGNGHLTPAGELKLPRRVSEWVPVFTPYRRLNDWFNPLRDVIGRSDTFRLGRHSAPERLVDDRYDAIDPADESRILAKLCLLNLYGRLQRDLVPGSQKPWFGLVKQLFVATRERIIAEVDRACWVKVRQLVTGGKPHGYRKSPIGSHKKNLEAVAGVADVTDLASVKTLDETGNLQLSVAKATQAGQAVYLLDADMDENGGWLPHAFDLVKHAFTGGTHPVEIHECLRAMWPDLVLGYELQPRVPVVDISTRVVAVAGLPIEVVPPPPDLSGVAAPTSIAVLGDSVTWGQGLLHAQKMHTLVAGAFGTGGAFPATGLVAHSGATIGVATSLRRSAVDGEVPKAHPTVLQQVADYPGAEAAAVDLVILNGGINDVDVRFILNPFTAPDDLEDTTARACGPDLLALLRAAAARFPAARILVLTYYPILSPLSRFSWGLEFLTSVGAPPPAALMASPTALFPSIWDRIVDNCRVFHVTSTRAMATAVSQANAEMAGDRFVLVDPGFRDEHAALAPAARLFGINWDLSPQDPVALPRRHACDLYEADPIRREQCYRASAGHPNAMGAQAYAHAVLRALAGVPA